MNNNHFIFQSHPEGDPLFSPKEARIREMVGKVEMGLYQEYELVQFIMRELIHPTQTLWLKENNLEIADLLNGRWAAELEPTVEALFLDWNLQCGTTLFRIA